MQLTRPDAVSCRAKVFGPYSDNIVPSHLKGEYPGGKVPCLVHPAAAGANCSWPRPPDSHIAANHAS